MNFFFQFKRRLKDLTAKMEHKIHEPDITTKKGRLKTHRKSKKEPLDTTDDLTSLEILDEVRGQVLGL